MKTLHNIRFLFFVIFVWLFGLTIFLFYKNPTEQEFIPLSKSPYKIFSTAQGHADLDEINKYVFEQHGYLLISNNGLIPILKKKVPMSCQNIFLSWKKIADVGLTIDPPKEIPNRQTFLMNNYAKTSKWYFNDTPKNTNESIKAWSQEYIDGLIKTAIQNISAISLPYGGECLAVYTAAKLFNIKGQEGAVIGSLTPWVEAYVLANGAKHVTTIDYQKIKTEHSLMNFLYAPDFSSESEKYYDKFDFVVSFSSIEHSGLGRYGDPLDPIGDIREMNKIHCILKNNGLLFLGLPTGIDAVVYNAHRIYGRIRLAMMFEGFRLLNVIWSENIMLNEQMQKAYEGSGSQYLYVLQKIDQVL
jgi:hypothetical protein